MCVWYLWNKTIEENVQYLLRTNDSSIYVMALKVQYEGFGVHSKDITKAVDINRYSLIFRWKSSLYMVGWGRKELNWALNWIVN